MKLSEGRRTEVYLVETPYGLSVLKKPKKREFFRLLKREREALRYLRSLSIEHVPEAYELSEEGLLEEYIPGEEFWRRKSKASEESLRRVILHALYVSFELDLAGVWHKELSLAHRHVLVWRGEAYIIDFGHSSIGIRRRSLPQLASYFFLRNRYLELFGIKKEDLIEALRLYKRGRPKRLIEALGLSPRRPWRQKADHQAASSSRHAQADRRRFPPR